jgi:DNA-binding response OmpR family regulator
MTQTAKRILLVDNDPDVLTSVTYSLSMEGYEVLPADNAETALTLMEQEIFHLAIFDIRLEEEKVKADTSGFEVATHLPAPIPCIIYTAYDDKENIRQAFSQIGAKEIIDKTRPDAPQKLIDTVNRLFEGEVKVNFQLQLEHKLDLDRLAAQVEIPRPDPELQPSAEDVAHILRTLFFSATSVRLVSLLSPEPAPTFTRSGSLLLQAQPRYKAGWGVPVVVKFGARDEIAQEAANHRLLKPFLGGQRLAVLEGEAYSRQIGGVVYSLIGAEDWTMIRPFGEVFQVEPAATVITLLERFFTQTFRSLLAEARPEPMNLTLTYVESLHLTPLKVSNALKHFYPQALTEPRLSFEGVAGSFQNPLLWAVSEDRFRPFEMTARKCLCHGDLHGRNVLVDAAGHFWLIDFARAAESHALRDFVELETDIKFNLLPVSSLQLLLFFETALLAPTTFQDDLPVLALVDDRLSHAYQVILALRRLAVQLIGLEGEMAEYYQALFWHTLNILRLRHIASAGKTFALLSAALLSERLEQWPAWNRTWS